MGSNCSSPCQDADTTRLPAPKPEPEKYVEDFIIVWLNPSTEQDSTKTNEIKEELQKHVNLVVICTHSDQCYEFISGIKDETVFLIVSAPASKQAISIVPESPRIDSTYYLNTKPAAKTVRIRHGNAVLEQFSDVKELGKQLKQDIKRCERNFVKPRIVDTNEKKILFMYDQLLQEIIFTSKKDDIDDVLDFWKRSYAENPENLNTLKEFEQSYSKDSAITWYTKDCGLYKATNNTLRFRKYDNLYALHVFIRHLHEQIVLKSKEHAFEGQIFYRGQAMDIEEFDHLKAAKVKTIFFPNFVSTSIDRNVALRFAQSSIKPNHEGKQVKVLFEINNDDNVSFPCADISQWSEFTDEKEWLFSMGSTYRVNDIELIFCDTMDKNTRTTIHHEIQIIKVTLIDDKDEQLMALKAYLKGFVKDENICLSLARVMYQMGDWKRSKSFYEKALIKEGGKYDREAAIHNNLGSIAFENKHYDDAVNHYKKSIELEEKAENVKSQNLVFAYQNIATVYYKQGQLDKADENLQKAIDIHNNSLNGDLNTIATIFNNMAHVLNSQGKHDQALKNNKKCLRIRLRILPEIHPNLAIAYNSMAITFNHLRLSSKSDEADEYAQNAIDCAGKAVNIDHQSLPPDHPQTKKHLKNLQYFEPFIIES